MGPKVRKSARNSAVASKAVEEVSEEKEETTLSNEAEVANDSNTNGVGPEDGIEEISVNDAKNGETQNGETVNDDVVSSSDAPVTIEDNSKNESGDSKETPGAMKNDEVPELEDTPQQLVSPAVSKTMKKTLSVKLRTQPKKTEEEEDFIEEVPVDKPEVSVVEILDDEEKPDEHEMTVIDEVTDVEEDDKTVKVKSENSESKKEEETPEEEPMKVDLTESIDPDTEMVSEDELPAETSGGGSGGGSKLDTEAVSDEELAAPDLPETEAVSEDELPPDKKAKEAEKDKEAETADSTATAENGKGVKRKLSEGDDKSSPASTETSGGNKEEAPAKKVATDKTSVVAKPPVKTSKLPELEKYWKAVKDDSSDFTGWTYLLQYVDQENDVEAAREAYDAFLSHYPYCYGYWRKYADYEKRKGNKKKSEEVFERGLKAIPLSVDLWIHYLNYCKATYPNQEDFIRTQFQKALDACGLEFRSDRLWESFIKWEADLKNVHNVTQLYDKLLTIPTQAYTTHFDNFVEHVSNNQPSKVLSVDEFLTLRQEVLQVLKQYDTPITTATPEGPPGDDDAPPGEESAQADAKKADEETTALRERIIALRRKVHKTTVAAVSARHPFEEGIKRPYFHVKPLERCQLKNWKDYLDYEVEQGDKDRIVTLFERCLIACALYEDFWMRYLRYLEDKAPEMKEKISDVYERACTIHHKKKPHLHLFWAVWEESLGNIAKAREILATLDKNLPGSMQVAFRRINLERRSGNLDECAALYEHYIAASAKSRLITSNLTIKYARFCWKSLNNVDKAVSILKKALEKDVENPRLYLQLIDMAMQRSPVVESEVVDVINQYISLEGADMEQILMFAQRKVEFLEDFGTDIKSMQKASEEFRKYLKLVKEKKKKLSEVDTKVKPEDQTPAAKKAKPDSSAATSGGVQTPGGTGGHNYNHPPPTYGGGPYGQQPPYGQQQPPYGPPYGGQSDPNYPYQNWNYNQPGYNYGNQGWGNYNYY